MEAVVPSSKPPWPTRTQRTILAENCKKNRAFTDSNDHAGSSRLPDATSSRDALQTLLECPWAPKGQWKVFQEGNGLLVQELS